MIRSLIVSLRNDRTDAVIPQPLADSRVTISLVPREPVGPHARSTDGLRDKNLIHDRLHSRGVVDLACGYLNGDGKALTVSNQVEFAAESPS